MNKPIELGSKPPEPSPSTTSSSGGPYFPSVYLSGIEGLDELPDKGEMTVKFRVARRTVSEDKDGKKNVSVDIELLCICEVEGKEDKPEKEPKTGDVLDEILKKLSEDDTEEED